MGREAIRAARSSCLRLLRLLVSLCRWYEWDEVGLDEPGCAVVEPVKWGDHLDGLMVAAKAPDMRALPGVCAETDRGFCIRDLTPPAR